MKKWRLINLGEMDAYTSVLRHEALAIAKKRGVVDNALILSHSLPSVRLGLRASFSLINPSLCKERDIPIVRTIMGGGALLNGSREECALVMDRAFLPSKAIPLDFFIKCTVLACQKLGLSAKQRPNSNDVLIGERKISGNNVNCFDNSLLCGGGITVDFDFALAKDVLNIPALKFEDKKAKSVEEWVTSVSRELNREVSFNEVEVALIQGFEETLQVEFDIDNSLTDAEKQIFESLEEKYRSKEWIRKGRWSPVKDYGRLD